MCLIATQSSTWSWWSGICLPWLTIIFKNRLLLSVCLLTLIHVQSKEGAEELLKSCEAIVEAGLQALQKPASTSAADLEAVLSELSGAITSLSK